MSAISGFINTIRNAVYGEQVRGAIINALEQCYSDVESPSLNQAAFTAAINAAYAGGILDIVTVTQISQMTNQQIIYRYNGTETGKQKGLYYYSALSSSWVLIGSEIHSVSNSNQMTDTNAIYKYTGTQSGMVQNSLYCYNGTAWVPIGSGVLTASTVAQMTNTDAIYKYTGNESGYTQNALYYYNGTNWTEIGEAGQIDGLAELIGEGLIIQVDYTSIVNKGINATTGEENNSLTYRSSNIIEIFDGYDHISIPWRATINTDGTPSNFGLAFYDSDNNFISGEPFEIGSYVCRKLVPIPSGAKYFRYSFGGTGGATANPVYLIKLSLETTYKTLNMYNGLTQGQVNCVNVTRQLTDTPYKTTNTGMPQHPTANVWACGMPYSSACFEDGYIGNSISIYTFMCAVKNPNSVLYNETSKSYTGSDYYGTVCTSLLMAAWGIPVLIIVRAVKKLEKVVNVPTASVRVGDAILTSTHAQVVTRVDRDAFGRVVSVEISESVTGGCTRRTQTFSSFKRDAKDILYRYSDIDGADNYVANEFLNLMDEEYVANPTYPDIMTYYGDKVTRKYGTDIPIHVLKSSGYSSIEVYKDGTQIDTRSVANFTISSPAVGSYEVRMIGTDTTSSTFFDIVSCSVSKNENIVTVTTQNECVAIGGYATYTTDSQGNATSLCNPTRVHLTDASEKSSGNVDIQEILDDSSCSGGIRVYVSGTYGNVSWEYPWSYFE